MFEESTLNQNLLQQGYSNNNNFKGQNPNHFSGELLNSNAQATTQLSIQQDMRSVAQSSIQHGDDAFLNSTDTNLVLLYNFREGKYQFKAQDRKKLNSYMDSKQFQKKVLNEIISRPSRMPFTQQISFPFQLFIKSLKYILFLGVCVLMFYLILIFILNPVVLVIMIVVLYFIFISLAALEERTYDRQRNKPLNDFIKKINEKPEFRDRGVLVVAGSQGKWIEIQLQDEQNIDKDIANLESVNQVLEAQNFRGSDKHLSSNLTIQPDWKRNAMLRTGSRTNNIDQPQPSGTRNQGLKSIQMAPQQGNFGGFLNNIDQNINYDDSFPQFQNRLNQNEQR